MSRTPFCVGAAPLLAALPASAAAADGGWGANDVSGVALLGVLAAVAWHAFTLHRGEIVERLHQLPVPHLYLGERLRHAVASARAHAPRRRAR